MVGHRLRRMYDARTLRQAGGLVASGSSTRTSRTANGVPPSDRPLRRGGRAACRSLGLAGLRQGESRSLGSEGAARAGEMGGEGWKGTAPARQQCTLPAARQAARRLAAAAAAAAAASFGLSGARAGTRASGRSVRDQFVLLFILPSVPPPLCPRPSACLSAGTRVRAGRALSPPATQGIPRQKCRRSIEAMKPEPEAQQR